MGVRDRQALGEGRGGGPRPAIAAAGLAALVAVAGLAGCGSATGHAAPAAAATRTGSASQVRSATSGTLCAGAGTVDRLTVVRLNTIPANHPHFSFPATVAVSDATQARAVARALCALEPQPGGAMACPIDLGIAYRLDFATAARSLPQVTIKAGGCETVSGAGLPLWSMRTPAFWTVLGQAMDLTDPGHAAFAGTMQP
jgi:hypothetical protein